MKSGVRSISYIERLRQLRDELLRASDPARREELLEQMLFLVEAQSQSRARGAEAAVNDSQSASARELQPPAIASPAREDAGPSPDDEIKPENLA